MMKQLRILLTGLMALALFIQSCSPSRQIGQFAEKELAGQPGVASGQVGICIYDPAQAKFLYDRQGDKYFIPASNTKLFSLYAGLKYLGDSLVGMRYWENDTALFIEPSGDPSFLHHDYARQPVIDILRASKKNIYITDANWRDKPLGRGWAWDDFSDDYMPERSAFPVYGNYISWIHDSASESFYSIPDIDWGVRFDPDSTKKDFSVQRDHHTNVFTITEGKGKYKEIDVPFITEGVESAARLLKDTVGRPVYTRHFMPAISSGTVPNNTQFNNPFSGSVGASSGSTTHAPSSSSSLIPSGNASNTSSSSASISATRHTNPLASRHTNPLASRTQLRVIHSQPVDSLFRPMMHRSDNFFAEQTLLMASNEYLGYMSDAKMIDTLLKSDLKDLPQKPYWVDGSGLSRNDLFTPRDFIWLLNKLQQDFGLPRLKNILPTGGTGTLASYYKKDSGFIFAKTGSLSGVVALSGYLITKKDSLLLFSVLVNNNSDPVVRRKIEKFIEMIREKY